MLVSLLLRNSQVENKVSLPGSLAKFTNKPSETEMTGLMNGNGTNKSDALPVSSK